MYDFLAQEGTRVCADRLIPSALFTIIEGVVVTAVAVNPRWVTVDTAWWLYTHSVGTYSPGGAVYAYGSVHRRTIAVAAHDFCKVGEGEQNR